MSWHSSMGREGPDAPGPAWPWREDALAEKSCPTANLMLHKASRERRSAKSLFQRSCQTCPWLHHSPGLFHSQATAALSFLHHNVYSHQHPPPRFTSGNAPMCSIAFCLSSAACPLLRARVPARVCQPAGRHDLRPVCNMLQRCLFSSGGGGIRRTARIQGYTNPSDVFKELLSICKERERKTNTRMKGFLEHDKKARKGDRDE